MKRRIISGLMSAILILVTTPFVLATDYDVELVVPDGKKSKETDAVLTIGKDDLAVVPDKEAFKSSAKTFKFSELKSAEYSYSKKPMLSGGGAVATAVLMGVFVLPFLFMKKKNHWMTVQTEKEFVVMKLDARNYKSIIAEFETHGVKVSEVKEEDKKKEK
jgi:hypothetical protein